MSSASNFRKICLSFSEVTEEPHFHKTSFRIKKKIFATFDEKTGLAAIKLSEKEQDLFCLIDPNVIYPVPNKWGKQGWTNAEISKIDPEVLEDLLLTAYQEVNSKK